MPHRSTDPQTLTLWHQTAALFLDFRPKLPQFWYLLFTHSELYSIAPRYKTSVAHQAKQSATTGPMLYLVAIKELTEPLEFLVHPQPPDGTDLVASKWLGKLWSFPETTTP
jgi:hypothetical protein